MDVRETSFTTADGRTARQRIRDVGQLIEITDRVGAKTPTALRTAHEHVVTIVARAKTIAPNETVVAAVISALEAGKDPAADPEVQRLRTAEDIAGMGLEIGVTQTMAARLLAELDASSDALVAAWMKPFDKAAAAIAACHKRIGDLPLDATDDILACGDDVGSLWNAARSGVATIDSISQAWNLLAIARTGVAVPTTFLALRLAEATPTSWLASGLETRSQVSAWDIHVAGLTLSLATPEQFVRRTEEATPEPIIPDPEPADPGYTRLLSTDTAA